MKKILFAAAAVLALVSSGCSTGGVSYQVPSISSNASAGSKAWYNAEAAFFAAQSAAGAAADAGILKGPRAGQVRDALAISYASLRLARAALATGDAGTFQRELAKSQITTAAAVSLLPERKP
jgi:hypothetical protein